VLVVASLVAAACGSSKSPSSTTATTAGKAATGTPIKVGLVAPLSGALAYLGSTYLPVLEASFKAINAQGGVNGHPLQVVAQDDPASAPVALTIYQDMAKQGIFAIMGPPISGEIEALKSLSAQLNQMIFAMGVTVSQVFPPVPNIAGIDIPPPAEDTSMLEFAKDQGNGKVGKVATAENPTAGSLQWAASVAKIAPKYGGTVVADQQIPLAASDVSAQARQIAGANPDVVLMEVSEANVIPMVRALRQNGFTGLIADYHGGGALNTVKELADTKFFVARTIALPTDTSTDPAFKAYQAAVKGDAQTAIEKVAGSGIAYLGGLIIAAGLKKCGEGCDGPKLIAAMQNLTVDPGGVAFGKVEYTSKSHQGLLSEVFYHWDGTKMAKVTGGKVYRGDVSEPR
jgi:branched-chain amino acid transport system substrate-binding protein